MQIIVILWTLLNPPEAKIEALRTWAPAYLTHDSAKANLIASGGDPMLLYIAKHESNFKPSVVSQEPLGKMSCGIMTPIPMMHCRPGQTLAEQYAIGAQHLKDWYSACAISRKWVKPLDKCALTGYAGGGLLIDYCYRHGTMWRKGKDLCATWSLYLNNSHELGRRLDGL